MAAALPTQRERSVLAPLTVTFAQLAGHRPVWARSLEVWNVVKNAYLEELREQVRVEARAEGRAEAQITSVRETIAELGRQRFGRSATKKQRAELDSLADLPWLLRIRDRLLTAESWSDLLSTP